MISSACAFAEIRRVAEKLISIIDDDESLRTALVGLVRSLGYRARGFACAEDFLNADEAMQSAAIVTDIQMPGISGLDLRRRLAADGRDAPVIMITARPDLGLEERAFSSGAFCFLRKPFSADALIACIERALAEERAPR